MHEIIEIKDPSDFDKLKSHVGDAYNPSGVAKKLKRKVGPKCHAILIEYPYVDKDYRSTYYHFYAKKGYRYESWCVRLHFFEDPIELGTGLELRSRTRALADNYMGIWFFGRPERLPSVAPLCPQLS